MASSGRSEKRLCEKEIKTLTFLRNRVLSAPPTKIQATSLRTWLVFSDGACEGEDNKLGTVGAVLINLEGAVCRYFSEQVPNP